MTGPERRQQILETSLTLFARQGYHGVTTREIAVAVGISEAMLYRHFRSKEELYDALRSSILADLSRVADRLNALEASTATLVIAVYYMVSQILHGCSLGERHADLRRLLLASFAEEGEFARGFLEANVARHIPRLVECLKAAARAGDMVGKPSHAALRVWLSHHLAAMVGNVYLPRKPVVDYQVELDVLINETVRFALRGLGLTEDAIARNFAPHVLRKLIQGLSEASSGADSQGAEAKRAPIKRGRGKKELAASSHE